LYSDSLLTTTDNVHCVLEWNGETGEDSQVIVRDTSKNGIVVNQCVLANGETEILAPGSIIRLSSGGDPNQKQHSTHCLNVREIRILKCCSVYIFRNAGGIVPLNNGTFHVRYDMGAESVFTLCVSF
jgi:hypothetical protein